MFGWIGGLWRLTARMGPAGPWLFLTAMLFLFALGATLLGFELGDIDRWLEAQSGWLDAVFSLLFQAVCGLVLLLCVGAFIAFLFDRKNPDRPGVGSLLLALVVGYFAWFGMIGD